MCVTISYLVLWSLSATSSGSTAGAGVCEQIWEIKFGGVYSYIGNNE
jgi:hypothetical protein